MHRNIKTRGRAQQCADITRDVGFDQGKFGPHAAAMSPERRKGKRRIAEITRSRAKSPNYRIGKSGAWGYCGDK